VIEDVGQLTEPELGGSTTAARVLSQADRRFGFGRHGASVAPCHARGVRWIVLALLAATTAHAAPCGDLPLLATRGRVVVRGELTRAQQKAALALVDGVVSDVQRRFGAAPAATVTLCLLGDAEAYTREASAFGDIPSEWGGSIARISGSRSRTSA
jgi:hypothetical protein